MLNQTDIHEIKIIVREEINERTRLLPTKEEFFSKMDEVMGELKATREAFELHTGQHDRINDQLEDHEERITKVENKTIEIQA